ncbi:hypothetical protein DMJ13_20425 [halophilic archaeon]|nr:hypothetical protein DMJ13_20425 [halophilic archaeon]
MKQTALRLPEDLIQTLDEEAQEEGVSRSEYMRNILESRHESHVNHNEYVPKNEYNDLVNERDTLEQRSEELRTEIDRLKNEKRQILQQREEHTELVEYVEQEKSLVEKREQRRKEREEAGIVTRLKWGLFGRSFDN